MRGHGSRYGSSDAVAIGTWEGKIRVIFLIKERYEFMCE